MTKDEALRLALKALESTGQNNGYHGVTQYFDEAMVDQAINAIKAALEAKDEPSAWMNKYGACKTALFREVEAGAKEEYTIPLYTTPPQRTWIGLTDKELNLIGTSWHFNLLDSKDKADLFAFVQAIEAKLKEKNT